MKGMKIKVDPELCDGCGTCIEVCPFKWRKKIDGKYHPKEIVCWITDFLILKPS